MTANDSRSFHLLPYWYGNLCERSAYIDTGPFRFVDLWVMLFCRVTLVPVSEHRVPVHNVTVGSHRRVVKKND